VGVSAGTVGAVGLSTGFTLGCCGPRLPSTAPEGQEREEFGIWRHETADTRNLPRLVDRLVWPRVIGCGFTAAGCTAFTELTASDEPYGADGSMHVAGICLIGEKFFSLVSALAQ